MSNVINVTDLPELNTERLVLRRITANDAAGTLALDPNGDLAEHIEDMQSIRLTPFNFFEPVSDVELAERRHQAIQSVSKLGLLYLST